MDVLLSDNSPLEADTPAIWSVTMPSEVILHCDLLASQNAFSRFGKVVSVVDLNE